jgi:hypothetical protein
MAKIPGSDGRLNITVMALHRKLRTFLVLQLDSFNSQLGMEQTTGVYKTVSIWKQNNFFFIITDKKCNDFNQNLIIYICLFPLKPVNLSHY